MQRLRNMMAGKGHGFLMLGLFALAIRAIMPAGFMPDTGLGTGGNTIVLSAKVCNADLAANKRVEIVIERDADGADHDNADQHSTDQGCAFASLAFAATGADNAANLSAILAVAAGPGGAQSTNLVPGQARLRPPARGPPLSV